jgi:hypothetical protein
VVAVAARAFLAESTPERLTAPKEVEPVMKTEPHPQGNSTPTVSKVLRAASTGTVKTAVKVVFPLAVVAEDVTLDTVGVELPWGWGSVFMTGSTSLGAVSLSGVDSAKKALAATATTVKVDKASVSRRSLHLLL